MKVKLLVCCHKKDFMATQAPYLPIHVGKALHPELDLGIQGDNTGDNISEKNVNYCELTGMFWAWKNLNDVDVIGLCHYRRYFDLSSMKDVDREPYLSNSLPNVKSSDVERLMNKYDIVIPGNSYIYESVMDYYSIEHSKIDFQAVENAIVKLYPEYFPAFEETMKRRNYYVGLNMLICKKSLFNNYCKWLFDILFEVENNVNIKFYDSYQSRIFGFMSERLLNVYIYHNQLSVCHRPVIAMISGQTPSRIKQIFHRIKANICFKLKYN